MRFNHVPPIIAGLFISSLMVLSVGLAVSALPVWLEGFENSRPDPNEKVRTGVSRILAYSIEEAKRQSKEAVDLQRNTSGIVAYLQTCNKECIRELARAGDPNAEYLVGWMCQYTSFKNDDYAEKWFTRAYAHGSAAAADELGNIYLSDSRRDPKHILTARWYEKATAGGDKNAKLHLGTLYEGGSAAENKKAMILFEQSVQCGNEKIAEDASHHLNWMWARNLATPSEHYRRNETNAYAFVCKYGSFWDADSLANRFVADGDSPKSKKIMDLYRISKERLAAAENDPKMNHKVEDWNAARTTAWSIGKSWLSFY